MRFFIIIMVMAGMLVANSFGFGTAFSQGVDKRNEDKPIDTNNLKECQNEQDKIEGCVEKNRNFGGYTEQYYKNGKENRLKVYYDNGQLALEIPITNKEYTGLLSDMIRVESLYMKLILEMMNSSPLGVAMAKRFLV